MLTALLVLVLAGPIGFLIVQYSRYGFVSPAAALQRFVTMLPYGVANHFLTPGFGTLERLIVGEIARTRFRSKGDEIDIRANSRWPCPTAIGRR